MLESKKMSRSFVGIIAALAIMIGCMPAEAAIGFPGRESTQTVQQPEQQVKEAQDEDIVVVYEPESVEPEISTAATVEKQPLEEEPVVTQSANYGAVICKADDEGASGIYDISGQGMIAQYLEKIGAKHRDKFYIVCATQEEFDAKCTEIKNLKSEYAEIVEQGKIPANLEQQLVEAIGSDEIWAIELKYKEPGHKSWLQKNGMNILTGVIGGVLGF